MGIEKLCGPLDDNSPISANGPELYPARFSLQSLSLQDCQKLSDESLGYISQRLPNLKSINLSFCVSITDTGLKSLAKMAADALVLRVTTTTSKIDCSPPRRRASGRVEGHGLSSYT